MSLPLGSRLGPYEIIGLLGAGGMGEVYRALDTRLNRQIAIKVLPPISRTIEIACVVSRRKPRRPPR